MRMSIGQTLELIYLDNAGKITQRKIKVCGSCDDRMQPGQPLQEKRYV
ncbi:hypothetical protein [Paenibacillus tianjinensis]|uniref:Uncharacterized protein n=1 Tax=Paenibacillus tianjinensis TaxID=2810347 RepID=A0ABX7L4L8_9BACL|nr:hypothetical protein [Paenibacillus tianjinensis]QSF42607.1 hypothetical protein JRJ22_14890 [Paenibacillus tianjinensis]